MIQSIFQGRLSLCGTEVMQSSLYHLRGYIINEFDNLLVADNTHHSRFVSATGKPSILAPSNTTAGGVGRASPTQAFFASTFQPVSV